MSKQAGTAHIVRIDGLTGVVELTVPIPQWKGSGYAPYGGALDPKFQPWYTGLRGELVRVNSDENPVTVTRFTPPANVQAYGMTVDQDGNTWVGGCSGPISFFDSQTAQWTTVAGTQACHRGVGAGEKYVWVASNSPCGLVQVDRLTKQLVKKHTPPQCSTAIGISIDIEGFLWLVDQGGWAWKIDQDNVQWDKKVNVTGSHYVYSDMTGGQVRSILPQ
jgi:streptogramin lyase